MIILFDVFVMTKNEKAGIRSDHSQLGYKQSNCMYHCITIGQFIVRKIIIDVTTISKMCSVVFNFYNVK